MGFSQKFSKNTTKWIDPCRGGGLGSARRHDGGRPRDRMSIAVLTSVNPPDRLFSPLETSSLTVWLSGNRAKVQCKLNMAVLSRLGFAEKRKKIKLCAARREVERLQLKDNDAWKLGVH